jgi:error-prone DNA polymerase
LLPPDVHLSGEDFTLAEDGRAIRVGLSYAKHLSRAAMSSILAEREKRPFASVSDLYARTAVEKDGLGSLIRGGFLDALGGRRDALLDAASRLPKKRSGGRGQEELPLPHPASWWEQRENAVRWAGYLPLTADRRERMEWEALALNVSRHPLAPYRPALGDLGVVPSSRMLSLLHGTHARAAGLLESLQRPPTKSGRPVYFLLVEDEWGLLQTTIFRPVYERYGDLLHHEGAFLLEGVVEQNADRGFSFLVRRIESLREVLADAKVPVPRAASSSGALLRAGGRSRRAG